MAYELHFHPKAVKEFEALSAQTAQRVLVALDKLTASPFERGSVKLKGLSAYRWRVGDYRIIYQVDTASGILTILRVSHRKDAYR